MRNIKKKNDKVATPGNCSKINVEFENVTDQDRVLQSDHVQEIICQEKLSQKSSPPGNTTNMCTRMTGNKQIREEAGNQNVKTKKLLEPGNSKTLKNEAAEKRKGIVKKLAEVFSPVRNARKAGERKLGISPKGKLISKTEGNVKKMPKAGKLINWKLNFEIFEKSATSALTEHTLQVRNFNPPTNPCSTGPERKVRVHQSDGRKLPPGNVIGQARKLDEMKIQCNRPNIFVNLSVPKCT